ncbi:MAG: hypothetical protein PHD86_01525 [Kiritimatiellae bacterium]|nr:hypothetical protein [Kiritimatiellia bacterium]
MQTMEVSQLNIPALAAWALLGLVVLISLAATVMNILRAKSKRERAFTLQSCLVVWLLLISLVLTALYVEAPYKYVALFALIVLFPLVVYHAATRRQLLQILEEREKHLGKNQDSQRQG